MKMILETKDLCKQYKKQTANHDIKTPLTLVKGNAELLLEAELGEEPEKLATTLRHSSEKIEQHIELLLDTAIVDKPSALCKKVFLLEVFILEV